MGSLPLPLRSILTIMITILALIPHGLAAKKAPAVAPGPKPAPLNLTAVLEKGGQYTTFIRLLKETQVGQQIESQLNNSFEGLTLFAPSDNAFGQLKPGTLNGLTAQEQVSLALYHVLPRYYSLALFETTSNPVRTQASGSGGVYTLNVTSTSSQVNVSTGVDETQISSDLYSDFPLAVYSVDQVLLPNDLFGAKPPAGAPAPAVADKKPGKGGVAASGPSAAAAAVTAPSAGSFAGRRAGWGGAVCAALVIVGSLM